MVKYNRSDVHVLNVQKCVIKCLVLSTFDWLISTICSARVCCGVCAISSSATPDTNFFISHNILSTDPFHFHCLHMQLYPRSNFLTHLLVLAIAFGVKGVSSKASQTPILPQLNIQWKPFTPKYTKCKHFHFISLYFL